MKNVNVKITCNCEGCKFSEHVKTESDLPYRYSSDNSHIYVHLTLHMVLPIVGMVLIGFSSWALVPVISFIAAYLFGSFFLCAKCSYHHENVRFCGCFPKSMFSYKKYRKWGHFDNLLGWPIIVFLLSGPTMLVLLKLNGWNGFKIYLLFLMIVVFIHSKFSCPNCRQRSLCYLGKLVLFIKKRK